MLEHILFTILLANPARTSEGPAPATAPPGRPAEAIEAAWTSRTNVPLRPVPPEPPRGGGLLAVHPLLDGQARDA